jgi:hypothetical protein
MKDKTGNRLVDLLCDITLNSSIVLHGISEQGAKSILTKRIKEEPGQASAGRARSLNKKRGRHFTDRGNRTGFRGTDRISSANDSLGARSTLQAGHVITHIVISFPARASP